MTKEEIQNRIEQVAYDGVTDGCNQAVIEREAERLATELVKLFAIPDVVKPVICHNCNKECEPIPLGLMCNKCYYDKM